MSQKCIYLIVDAYLNFYFIRTVKTRLVAHGVRCFVVFTFSLLILLKKLTKYQKLVRYNIQIMIVSLSMDVLLIGEYTHN